jgi:hypothetical protein
LAKTLIGGPLLALLHFNPPGTVAIRRLYSKSPFRSAGPGFFFAEWHCDGALAPFFGALSKRYRPNVGQDSRFFVCFSPRKRNNSDTRYVAARQRSCAYLSNHFHRNPRLAPFWKKRFAK